MRRNTSHGYSAACSCRFPHLCWFETIEEMLTALDDYLAGYNTQRPHQGRGMQGRIPLQAFRSGIGKPQKETQTPSLQPAA